MTPVCAEHAALLRGIAKNTNNQTARKVYADWLQERGNPGWVILLNYHPRDWVIADNGHGSAAVTRRQYGRLYWRLPWLDGHVEYDNRIAHSALSVLKRVLGAYADGQTVDPNSEEE